jgi:hypothetical protein
MPASRSSAKTAGRRAASTRTPRTRPPAVKPVVAALQEVLTDPAGAPSDGPLAAVPVDAASPVTSFIPLAPSEPADAAIGTGGQARKTASSGKAAKAGSATAGANAAKAKKPKLVRDSFTIPKPEYAVLEQLKLRAARLGQPAKKSEVLRAGLKALEAMSDATLLASLAAVPRVKTGRPAKD